LPTLPPTSGRATFWNTLYQPAIITTSALANLAVNLLGDDLQGFTDPRLRGRYVVNVTI